MLLRITNAIRDYAWGSRDQIANYLGLDARGGPEAELWLGAHPAWPAKLDDGTALDAALRERGLPQPGFLLKVLAAAEPLSLQAHPSDDVAQRGFAREQEAGLPIDAPTRNYRDPHAKPELIVAVSAFEALCGFREQAVSREVLDALAAEDPRVAPLAARADAPIGETVAWLLSREPDVADVVAGITAAASAIAATHPRDADTIARLDAAHPGDAGVAVAMLMHRISLAPGEALALPAGNLHAYLEGLGIELMGPSDNVLRGGLTTKHVDRDELLAILDARPIDDPRCSPVMLDGAAAYRPDLPFELRHVRGAHAAGADSPAVVLAVAAATCIAGDERLALAAGEAAYCADARALEITSEDAWVALERRRNTPKA